MSAVPSSRSHERWFLVALVALFVGISVHYCFKVAKGGSAIVRWQAQLADLEAGEDIAARHNFPNPPVMAVLLEPLAHLPPIPAALIWFYLKVGMTLLALLWVFRMVENPGRPFPVWAKVAVVLLSLRPIIGDLEHGNVNLFILFLVVGSLYAYTKGRDLTAGVVLALAIACKVTPALFVPYFLWKRSAKVLIGCAVGLTLFLWPGFVPALRLGMDDNLQQLGSWYGNMVHPFVVEGKVTSEHNNQSLPGVAFRLLTHSPSHVVFPDNVWTPSRYANLASLDPAVVRTLLKAAMVLFAALVVWRCRTPASPRGGWRLAAEYGVVVLGMLLFSERTWKHHCVTLVLPFSVLCYVLATESGAGRRVYLVGSLALAALLMLLTSTDVLGNDLGEEMQIYGPYVAAYLVLLVPLFVVLRPDVRGRRAAARPSSLPVTPAA